MNLFDGHGDIWTDVTCKRKAGERDVFRRHHLEKFRKGQVTGGIFVVWIDPPFTRDLALRSQEIIAAMHEEMLDAADILHPVLCFEDFAVGTRLGKINVVNGLEGMDQIGDDVDQIDALYEQAGIRHGMLTWNRPNKLAAGVEGDPDQGLSDAGRRVLRRMQDLGMVVDVSHLNDKSFWEALELVSGPLIASHSNCRTLCDMPRNLTDAMLRAVAETGGVVGINTNREFTYHDPAKRNVAGLADHVDHMAQVMGSVRHIGFGFDFDDYISVETLSEFISHVNIPPSCDGIVNESQAHALVDELARRGYSTEDLALMAEGNFYRVFKAVW